MNIGIYAGSIRPGGGLTVILQIVEALANNYCNNIVVFTGAKDTSFALNHVFRNYKNVKEVKVLQGSTAQFRYFVSKFYFLVYGRRYRLNILFSFNYYVPAKCPVAVYHINLFNFEKSKNDNLGMMIKRIDSMIACRAATVNIFESRYLMDIAHHRMGEKIRNPKLLYIGVNEEFYAVSSPTGSGRIDRTRILLVSSPQEHKDNGTCIRAVKLLCEKRPDVPWRLVIAGGQDVSQWENFRRQADQLGVGDCVEFLGPVPLRQLAVLMRESLCLVNASRVESFCMVAVEAMAASCPAIVTDCTSMPESVGDAAVVVQAGAADQFADAALKFFEDDQFRAAYLKRGLSHASRFTRSEFEKNINQLMDEYLVEGRLK